MRPIYALTNLFDKHPITIAGVVVAGLNFLIARGTVDMTGEEVASLETFLVLALGLFVASKTANVSVLNDLADTPPTVDGVELAPATGATPAKPKRARKQGGASDLVVLLVVVLIVLLALGYFGGVR